MIPLLYGTTCVKQGRTQFGIVIFVKFFRFPDSRLAKMFNGSIPIILDSLKQHYFIDRDGDIFRHILNFLRAQRLQLPHDFRDWKLLLDEARFYDIAPMISEIERARDQSASNGLERASQGHSQSHNNNSNESARVRVKVEEGVEDYVDCVLLHISPDLGERVSLSANKNHLNEIFPELSGALLDSRNSGWTVDSNFVLRFPLNGFCKLNSIQVIQRLLAAGYHIASSSGGGVEGQQFSEYLFCKKL